MDFEKLQSNVNEFHEKAIAGIDGLKNRIEEIEVKLDRPGVSGSSDPARSAAKKAFSAYVSSGDESGLQKKDVSVGSPNDGGVAVPKVISSNIEQLVVERSSIRSIAMVTPVNTNPGNYSRLVDTRGTSSGWVGETAGRPTTDTPQLQEITFPDGEIYANPRATQRAIDDMAPNVADWIEDSVATEFAFQEGAAFINGDGVNKPRGFLTGPVTDEADAARSFGTLQYIETGADGAFAASNPADILIDLVHTLKATYRQNAHWVMNSTTLAIVRKLKDGDGNFIWRAGVEQGQPDRLLGYPITEAEDMPDIATNSLSIAFGNFARGYEIVDRQEIRTLRDPYTAKPYVNFYTTKRVSGSLINSEAIKLLRFSSS